jgi:hypothetical protein
MLVISSGVERSLHALRLVEMTKGRRRLVEMTKEGRLVEMTKEGGRSG